MKSAKKTGRKQKHFEDPKTGLPVVGLSRMPDGRWRLIGSQIRFTEPDEQKAIAHFRKLKGEKLYEGFDPEEAKWLQTPAEQIVDANAATAIERGFALVGKPEEAWPKFWRYVANEIITKPKWVAEQTGIEKLGYLTNLKPPEKLPTFAELRKLWEDHAKCSVEQMKKVRTGWDHFVETTGASRLEDISPALAIDYRDALHDSGYGGKTQAHFIAGIRRVLTNAKDRAVAMTAVSTALTYLELLKPSEVAEAADPKPIEVAEWKTLYAAAESADDKALLLLCLNGAFYLKEAIELEWEDVKDGCIVTNRQKTGRCIRVCTLWKETTDALGEMKRRGDKLFYTYQGQPIKICGAFRRFGEVRGRAKLTDGTKLTVTASQLRDGAYTAAVEAGVSFQFCQLLAGHSCGMADKYVKRQPQMVKPACDAIYSKYMT